MGHEHQMGELLVAECFACLQKGPVLVLKTDHALMGYHCLMDREVARRISENMFVEKFEIIA